MEDLDINTGHDIFASQFSPDGNIYQIRYASTAVENSTTIIGLRGKTGVVLAVERKIKSKLIETTSNERIYKIDQHIGMAIAGLLADGKAIVDIAREEANNFFIRYNRLIPLKILNERLSSYIHAYTLYSAVRPFGVSVILASCTNKNVPEMYVIEPSGDSYGYFGCAHGKTKKVTEKKINKKLEELKSMDDQQLITAAKEIIENKDRQPNGIYVLDIYYVGQENGNIFKKVNTEEE